MKKHFIYFFLLFIPFTYSLGQITITQSDLSNLFTIGNTQTDFFDTNTVSLDIGNPGGNNNWDFQHLVYDDMLVGGFVDPTTTPFTDIFPDANIASTFTFELIVNDTTTLTSESWNYYSNSSLLDYGNAGITTTTTTNTSSLLTTITTHIPPFAEYDFPIEFGKVWSQEDSTMTQILEEGVPIFENNESIVYNYNIDAWGTMIMPSGKSVEALRSREQTITTSYLIPGFTQTSTSVHYFFMGKGGESLSILADSENPANSGAISGLVGWGNDDVTSVEKLDEVPKEFHLSQNYPNPFNPSTTIEYSITEPLLVKLKVYDILGNEVSELVNKTQTSGTYRYNFNASILTSGIYLLQLQAGSFNDIIKMTVLK